MEKWDGNGNRLHYSYDSQDRIISIKGGDGQEKSFTYDLVGNRTSITDANGGTTRFRYSPTGNLISAEDKEGNLTRYGYDSLGNLTVVFRTGSQREREMDLEEAIRLNQTQHSLHLTLYERDLSGQIVSITNPLGNKEQYEYDEAGNILKTVDREGYSTSYTYTRTGQVESVLYGNGDKAEYFYDSLQQLREVKDWLGTTTAEYDKYGRVQKITDHRGQSVSYEFGDMGERQALIYPDGKRVEYAYDKLLRLEEVRSGQSRINYRYGPKGKLSERSCSNGLSTSYLYDDAGRLKELLHKMDDQAVEHFQYTYDKMGNKTGIWKYRRGMPGESGEYRYEYDYNGRLTAVEKDGQTVRKYEYDSFDNRIAMYEGGERTEYSYNAADQLMQRTGPIRHMYRYDARGNLTEICQDGIIKNSYTYNSMNRLSMASAASGRSSRYIYNGLDKRIAKAEERAGTGSLQTEYLLDLTKDFNDLLALENQEKRQTYLWGDGLEGMEEEGNRSFALLDELGSPVRFLWSNGRDLDSYSYDEFGCDQRGNMGEIQPFSYTGYLFDGISGTCFAQAREYSPELGRFTGEDIAEGLLDSPCTLNPFIYCYNSALNFIDLLGDFGLPLWLINLREDGNDAHKTLRAHAKYPGLKAEQPIKAGLKKEKNRKRGEGRGYYTPSGTGRADYIYYMADGTMEVFELKHDTKPGHVNGNIQLKAYIRAIYEHIDLYLPYTEAERAELMPGDPLYKIFNNTYPSLADPENKIITYHTDPYEPGLIFYKVDKKPKPKPVPAPVVVPEPETKPAKEKGGFWTRVGTGLAGAGLLAGGIFLFFDDATGVGVADDPAAGASVLKGIEMIMEALSLAASCPAVQ